MGDTGDTISCVVECALDSLAVEYRLTSLLTELLPAEGLRYVVFREIEEILSAGPRYGVYRNGGGTSSTGLLYGIY